MISRYIVKSIALFLFLCSSLVIDLYSQTCGLTIEASPADSEVVLKGVFATAVSRKTSRIHQSAFRQGLPYFANLPEGEYRLTVRKVGFKQTIDSVSLACDEAENGVVTTYVSLWPGPSNQSVDLAANPVKEMRLDRMTKLSSNDDHPHHVAPVDPSVPRPMPKTVSGGVLNGKAIYLVKPEYPAAARAVRAGGSVSVQVLVDESGNVILASAVSGHPLLREASEAAAREARFPQTLLSGVPVKVSGVITFNFVP
jgi:TonB family protein